MASAFVQAKSVDTSGTSASFAAFTLTAGNTVIVAVRYGIDGSSYGVSDNLGNTYTNLYNYDDTTNLDTLEVWVAKNATGGSCTVTVTVGSSATIRGTVAEFSGVDTVSPVDQSSTPLTVTTNATSITSNSITTTQAAEMLVSFVLTQGAETFTAGTLGSGTGTIDANATSSKTALMYHHETSTGTYSGTFNFSALDNGSIVTFSLKDAGGGGGAHIGGFTKATHTVLGGAN